MNIWNWFLSAAAWVVQVLIVPLFGGPSDAGAAVGLAALIGNSAYTVLEMAYAILSQFNMGLAFVFGLLTLALINVQFLISIYSFILGLIKKLPTL